MNWDAIRITDNSGRSMKFEEWFDDLPPEDQRTIAMNAVERLLEQQRRRCANPLLDATRIKPPQLTEPTMPTILASSIAKAMQ